MTSACPSKLLHRPKVVAVLEQVGCKRMAEDLYYRFSDAGLPCRHRPTGSYSDFKKATMSALSCG